MGIIAEWIANDKAVEIARNLLKEGLGVDLVTKATSLDKNTVLNLQAELNPA